MNAPKTGRRFDPGSSVVFVAIAVFAACTGVAVTAWWSLDMIHASRLADSRGAGLANPLSPANVVDAGREQFTRYRPAFFAAQSDAVEHRLFNAASCAECHRQGGLGGGGPNENNVQLLTPLAIARDPSLRRLSPDGGPIVLHRQSVAAEYADWRQGVLNRLLETLPVQNRVSVSSRAAPLMVFGRRPGLIEERNTPPLFGLGLLGSIPQREIDWVASTQPPELRGRSPRLKEGGFGRFGWKASTATLVAFNENACAVELGLTTPSFAPATFRPAGISRTAGKSARPSEPVVRTAAPKAPDMSASDVAALTRYIESLPAPRQVIPPEKREQVLEGVRHFEAIGCAECHTPNLGSVTGVYSDLLLHQVGTEGGGFYRGSWESEPNSPTFDIIRSNEFRTPPLWGVADSAPYLHDGSAATLEAAIIRHANQANRSNLAYQNSTPLAKAAVIAFLETLRAP